MKEVKLDVFGRVQGVNLRNTIKEYCDSNGIHGYVMNRQDGSVFVIAQGLEDVLKEFVLWLKKNPGFSSVEKVVQEWREPSEKFDDFEVRRSTSFFRDRLRGVKELGKYFLQMQDKIPRHVAIIPDGNRRWARSRGIEAWRGHDSVAKPEVFSALFKEAKHIGIEYLSLWAFSTENWNRDPGEIEKLMGIILKSLKWMREEAQRERIRFRHVGRKDRLPEEILEEIKSLEKETKDFDDFNIQIFLDYGGRDEIVRTARRAGKNVSEEEFSSMLDTGGLPDPDLIIRTGGERRLSGFMPFQGTYAELYFTDVLFPEFKPENLREAIAEFSRRQRRFGT